MFLFIILYFIESRRIDKNKENMDSFQIKGIHFCVSDHHQTNVTCNQILQDSMNQNQIQSLVQEIENIENQYPFQYSDLVIYLNKNEIHITGSLNDHAQNVSIVNQQIRIAKYVYFKNMINTELMITNIISTSSILKVDFQNIILPPKSATQKTKVCTVIYEQPLSEIRQQTFEIVLVVEIAYFLRLPIKLIVYNKHLMCQTKLQDYCNVQGQHLNIEFNNLGVYQQYTKIFSFYNPNPVKIHVEYKQTQRRKNRIRVLLVNPNDIKSISKHKFSFEMQPFTRIELKVVINTNYYEILSDNILTFTTQYEIIEILVKYSVQRGQVNYYPSVLNLDSGMIKKVQEFDVQIRSTFRQPIQLISVEHQQIKFHNITIQTLSTNIDSDARVNILHIDYMSKQIFNQEFLNSFGRNNIKIQTDVLQDLEILVNYGSNQNLNDQNLQTIINQEPKIQISQQTVIIQEKPNIFMILISVFNMLYIAILLRNNIPKSKKLKILIDCNYLHEPIDFQSIFKVQDSCQIRSKSETNEIVSENSSNVQDIMIQEDTISQENIIYTNLQSQIEESSSHFSQGESIDEDQMSEYQEKVVEQGKVTNNKNFNLFQRVEFTIPRQFQTNSQYSQECWNTKDPIFLPQESDEEIIDNNNYQRVESILNQIEHKLQQFEQSTIKVPLKWNENKQINTYPYFPKFPPGI